MHAIDNGTEEHDLFSVDPWEQTIMKFAANLNLKGHQYFFTRPVHLYKFFLLNCLQY